MNRKTKAAVATAILTAGTLVAAPAAANAAATGCSYPYVCLYQNRQMSHPSGRFRDVTAGWQWLTRSRGAKSFRNTRHDDVAFIKLASGKVICVPPRTSGGLYSGGAVAIRISYRSTCR